MAATIMQRRGGGSRRANGTTEVDSFDSSQRSNLGPDSFDDDNSNYGTTNTSSNGDRKPATSAAGAPITLVILVAQAKALLSTFLLHAKSFLSSASVHARIQRQEMATALRHPDLHEHVKDWFQQSENQICLAMALFMLLWIGTVLHTILYASPMSISSQFHPVRTSSVATFDDAFGPDGVEYHMVFSTGCSTFQDWQSYVFFYHAWKSGQPGHVTRIASGCKEEDEVLLRKIFQEQIGIMSPRFHLHITPEFSNIKPGVNFKYFNKPFGLRHWMEHVLGYPKNTAHDDAVIMLLDPDQIVLRPFTQDFTNSTEVWIQPNLGKLKVERGQMFGQKYGFGAQWKTKVNMSKVFLNTPTPVDDISVEDASAYYAAGPPYVGTGKDMYRIAKTWSDIVPAVHEEYPFLLAEMFAYCIAAAHSKLPHQMAKGFMVSDVTDPQGEGWELIDRYPKDQVCYIPQEGLPHVIHYCQHYNLGKWHFGKFRLRKDFISCGSSLLMEPPPDVAAQYVFSVTPTNELTIWRYPHTGKRNGFMLCMIIKALNDAAIFYKQHNCPAGTANFAKNYSFHKNMQVEQQWLDKVKEELKKRPMMKEDAVTS